MNNHKDAMNNPGNVVTLSEHTDRMQRQQQHTLERGDKTQGRVEAANYIDESSPLPFAAMWFNEGQRDQMKEGLKHDIEDRTRRNNDE